MHADFDDLRRSLLFESKSLLPKWLPNGRWEGNEWVALNPTRGDSTLGSFKTNYKTGHWKDNAMEDFYGTNLLDLYAACFTDKDCHKAAQELSGQISVQRIPIAAPVEPANKPQPILPEAPPPSGLIQSRNPAMVHEYRTLDDELMGYVLRIEKSDGSKVPLPLFYFPVKGWDFKGFTGKTKRPLYGLHLLKQKPYAKVLLVEGEKCADFGRAALDDDWIVLSWFGGSAAFNKTDYSPLAGREVFVWPDNDEIGYKAADYVAKVTKGTLLAIPEGKPKGWDIAEASEFDIDQIVYKATEAPTTKRQHYNSIIDNEHYTYLGYNIADDSSSVVHNFYVKSGYQTLLKIKTSQFTIGKLADIAPEDFWASYRGFDPLTGKPENKESWMANIANQLKEQGGGRHYNGNTQRSLGVWKDTISSTGYVFHVGNRVVAGDKDIPFGLSESGYLYCKAKTVPFADEPLPLQGACRIPEILNLVSWERKSNAMLLSGWLFIANVAGVLDWRPHIYLYGPAGSGKTTVQGYINNWLDGFSDSVTSKTTEAGVRGQIASTTMPFMIDEFENYGKDDKPRLENMLNLITGSSSGRGEGRILKGTKNGGVKEYTSKSTFCLSSINPFLIEQAHKERFTELKIVVANQNQRAKDFAKQCELKEGLDKDFPDIAARLRRRAYDMLPELQATIKVFKLEFEKKGYGRLKEQLAPLMAGYWLMTHDTVASEAQAAFLVSQIDFSENEETETTSEWANLLTTLAQHIVKVQSSISSQEITIGEMVYNAYTNRFSDVGKEYRLHLSRRGLRLEGDRLLIANKNAALESVFTGTLGNKNWNKIILNCPDSKKEDGKHFSGTQGTQRSVSIPVETLLRFSREAGLVDEINQPPQAPPATHYAVPATPAKAAPVKYKIEEDPPF